MLEQCIQELIIFIILVCGTINPQILRITSCQVSFQTYSVYQRMRLLKPSGFHFSISVLFPHHSQSNRFKDIWRVTPFIHFYHIAISVYNSVRHQLPLITLLKSLLHVIDEFCKWRPIPNIAGEVGIQGL